MLLSFFLGRKLLPGQIQLSYERGDVPSKSDDLQVTGSVGAAWGPFSQDIADLI